MEILLQGEQFIQNSLKECQQDIIVQTTMGIYHEYSN